MNQRLKAAAVLLLIILADRLAGLRAATSLRSGASARRKQIRRPQLRLLLRLPRSALAVPARRAPKAPYSGSHARLFLRQSLLSVHFTRPTRRSTSLTALTNSPRIDAVDPERQAHAQPGRRHFPGSRKQYGHRRATLHSSGSTKLPAPRALRRERQACFRSDHHRASATSRKVSTPVNNPFLAGVNLCNHRAVPSRRI